MAFALHDDTSPIASIAIEGPAPQFGAPRFHETLGQWTDILRSLQKIVAARPTEFSGPFAHVHPAIIAFASAV